jgi:hypothetical protein
MLGPLPVCVLGKSDIDCELTGSGIEIGQNEFFDTDVKDEPGHSTGEVFECEDRFGRDGKEGKRKGKGWRSENVGDVVDGIEEWMGKEMKG